MAADHGRLEPASMRGDLFWGCQAGIRPLQRPSPIPSRAQADEITPPPVIMMIGRMTAPAARMMSLYARGSSEMDDFR
jgi:hypothetical protein